MKCVTVAVPALVLGCGRIGFDATRATDGATDTAGDTTVGLDAPVCSTATFDTLPSYLTLFGSGGMVTTIQPRASLAAMSVCTTIS